MVCPGKELVYTCRTTTGVLSWKVDGGENLFFKIRKDTVNSTRYTQSFTFQLTEVVLNEMVLISTATAEIARASLDGASVECRDGKDNSATVVVDVAGTHMYMYQ